MKFPDTIGTVLAQKGTDVWSIAPDAMVFQAVEKMAEKGIGALLVMAQGKLLGIVSERDYARKVILKGLSSKQARIDQIMTSPAVSVKPAQTVDDCMALMTERRIRHLPVIDGGKVVGVVSIGDLVKWIISKHEETIQQLEDYISGKYPG